MQPKLLVSDSKNRIFDVSSMAAAGMKAGNFYPLRKDELIPLPYGSELFMLQDRIPVGFGNKPVPGGVFPVAAFLSPGYTVTYNAAYIEKSDAKLLPLFSYAAVCWYKGGFYTTAVKVDREKRQDLRLMDIGLLRSNVRRFRKIFPKNRLIRHLVSCACVYGCPAAKNFFLQRYECPLPASPHCNSGCIGCISVSHSKTCPHVQPRIKFIPTASEIAEVALYHIKAVRDPVVSFGQGCEGEPLMVSAVLEEAIKLIRAKTQKGVINLNTNANSPEKIKKLRFAGLDSIRVSLNSLRERFYNIYYKPKNYTFSDVLSSLNAMKSSGGFVSINYLVMPGFTDLRGEAAALYNFIRDTKIDMIQWRNLNYDPVDYFKKMKITRTAPDELIGVKRLIEETDKRFPGLRHGYFNPKFI